MNVNPWELNPVLTEGRLVTLARAAVTTRNRAFSEADRAAGDTNWGLACKAHERLMHVLGHLAGDGEHPWLTVIRDGLYVMPRIEEVPVRLFRGTADRPGARHLDALRLEHERVAILEGARERPPTRPQMAFEFIVGEGGGDEGGPWYWLMAMETDAAGMVSRVVFFQANDASETRYPWVCPLAVDGVEAVEAPMAAIDEVSPVAAPVVEAPLAAPVVETPVAPEVPAPLAAPVVEAPVAPDMPAPLAASSVEATLPLALSIVELPPAAQSAGEGTRARGRRTGRSAPRVESRQAELWGATAAE